MGDPDLEEGNELSDLLRHKSDSGFEDALAFDMASRLAGVDESLIAQARIMAGPLGVIADYIKKNESLLTDIDDKLSLFEDSDRFQACASGAVATFFANIEKNVGEFLRHVVNDFRLFQLKYDSDVAGKFGDKKAGISNQRAVHEVRALVSLAFEAYKHLCVDVPQIVRQVCSDVTSFNKYLRGRFVKPDVPKQNFERLRIVEDENDVDYEKISFIENNPVLTEFLLGLLDLLPRSRDVAEKKNGRRVRVREVSKFAIGQTANDLIGFSDGKFVGYLDSPRDYFAAVGENFRCFMGFVTPMMPLYDALFKSGKVQISAPSSIMELLRRKKKGSVERDLSLLYSADVEPIVQRDEDVLPENARERELFAAREKLLLCLLEGVRGINIMTEESVDGQVIVLKTEDVVKNAVDLKAELDDLLVPHAKRKLRSDIRHGRDYYVGRQGDIGMFHFERAPAPNVKLEDVVGKSFDGAKENVSQIIYAAKFPHVMRLSSPNRTVKSNMLLIGPYGCGKSEFARAVCSDERVIGASVRIAGAALTAFMHESVNNVMRIYEGAKQLYVEGREVKPVMLVLDEFDGWFANEGAGIYGAKDMQQIETAFLEILDGMEDYTGVVTIAMTNRPERVPKGILRRFRYVGVVGQLTNDERALLLKKSLEQSMPVVSEVEGNYDRWAKKLEGAPGDVVRKVADEVYFGFVPKFVVEHPEEAKRFERILRKRDMKLGRNSDKDVLYLREKLRGFGVVTVKAVDAALDNLLRQPPIQLQINKAKQVYERAAEMLDSLSDTSKTLGWGKSRTSLFDED